MQHLCCHHSGQAAASQAHRAKDRRGRWERSVMASPGLIRATTAPAATLETISGHNMDGGANATFYGRKLNQLGLFWNGYEVWGNLQANEGGLLWGSTSFHQKNLKLVTAQANANRSCSACSLELWGYQRTHRSSRVLWGIIVKVNTANLLLHHRVCLYHLQRSYRSDRHGNVHSWCNISHDPEQTGQPPCLINKF